MYSKGSDPFVNIWEIHCWPICTQLFFLYNNVFTKINTTKNTFNSVPVAIV